MMRPQMPNQTSLARLLAFALAAAVMCNGLGVYLKRTGFLEGDKYRAYWSVYCAAIAGSQSSVRQCTAYTSPGEIARAASRLDEPIASTYSYVYDISPPQRLLKLAKDLFWLLMIGLSVALSSRHRNPLPHARQAWPVFALASYATAAMAASVALNGALVAGAGLRAFVFLSVPILGRWLLPHLALFAKCVAALLVFEAALVPLELVRGIHLFHEWTAWSLASRVVGTLVQPNSMGIFAASAIAFYHCSFPSSRWNAPLLATALALILFSGSGTGLVCVAFGLLLVLGQRENSRRRPRSLSLAAAVLALLALALLLPAATGRPDLYSSLGAGGRWTSLQAALFGRSPIELIFGSGLGVNTNSAFNLANAQAPAGIFRANAFLPTDSTLTSLLIQVGVVGAALFYAMLFWAAARDDRFRIFYGVVALSSLTINLTELFPVNVLLGLALAHSCAAATNPHGRDDARV
jgi:hypothetical protein